MDKEMLQILLNYQSNRELYISMSSKYKEAIIKQFDKFEKCMSEYYNSLCIDVNNRNMYSNSLKQHKMSPYIAGGMAQGIAGIGAGLYAANSASERNKQIQATRDRFDSEVTKSSYNLEKAKNKLLTESNKLVDLLEKDGSLERTKKYLQEQATKELTKKLIDKYNLFKKQIDDNDDVDYKEAIEVFEKLGGYKESKKYYYICKMKIDKKKNLIIRKSNNEVLFFILFYCN